MKALIVLLGLVFSVNAMADIECNGLATKVDNNQIYAEVISQSHMDLEFVVFVKANYGSKVKVVGGYDYELSTLPGCDSAEVAPVKWTNKRFGTHWTSGGSSSFSAAYRVCLYNYRNELAKEYTVCNSEVGD